MIAAGTGVRKCLPFAGFVPHHTKSPTFNFNLRCLRNISVQQPQKALSIVAATSSSSSPNSFRGLMLRPQSIQDVILAVRFVPAAATSGVATSCPGFPVSAWLAVCDCATIAPSFSPVCCTLWFLPLPLPFPFPRPRPNSSVLAAAWVSASVDEADFLAGFFAGGAVLISAASGAPRFPAAGTLLLFCSPSGVTITSSDVSCFASASGTALLCGALTAAGLPVGGTASVLAFGPPSHPSAGGTAVGFSAEGAVSTCTSRGAAGFPTGCTVLSSGAASAGSAASGASCFSSACGVTAGGAEFVVAFGVAACPSGGPSLTSVVAAALSVPRPFSLPAFLPRFAVFPCFASACLASRYALYSSDCV
mmetsp:Transcript_137935/g.257327  ORF Transcript_137935/g.257327 Transcript_137935/m.257327 type:complete len:363 (-) Transcript_137935:87-1175(-)